MRKIKEAYVVNNTLNPKLWDLDTLKLWPEVRSKIVNIVEQFEDSLDVPISICDVHIVGSQANYNYSPHSDLDVHIIANFDIMSHDTELLRMLYDAKKARFNEKYSIKIRGIDVELYIEDVRTSVISNGIYSICEDKWIKKPIRNKLPPPPHIEKETANWIQAIGAACKSGTKDDIEDLINRIYMMRKNSIAVDGEYGKGNLIFKAVRDAGSLDKLKDALYNIASKELSLESLLSRGELVNLLED